MELVQNSYAHLANRFGAADWVSMDGADGVSRTYRSDDRVVKIRPATRFEARFLVRAFEDVHGALAADGLAPAFLYGCYDGELLGTVCTWAGGAVAERPTPDQVGAALARSHHRLAPVPVRSSAPWIGFYGEYAEFAAVIPAVEDDELRTLGETLLPTARRATPPSSQYVHRDAHPANVVFGDRGVCFIDWELVHAGGPIDDLAMTALMWAAESDDPGEVVAGMLAGYASAGGAAWHLADLEMRTAIALCGLRQGIGGWYTDEGECTAPYWPAIRARIRTAAALLCT